MRSREIRAVDQELNSDIAALAQEIEAYLAAHPDAADTMDGIARWWLPRQRLEDAMHKIEQALAYLAAHGRIGTRRLGSGEQVFTKRSAPAGDQLPVALAAGAGSSMSKGVKP
jgi:hypothetical protein